MSRTVRIPGFYPINWHTWNRHTGRRPWAPSEMPSDASLWRWRLHLLWTHRRCFR